MDTPNLKTSEGRKLLTDMFEKEQSTAGQKIVNLVKEYESTKGLLGPIQRFMLNRNFDKIWKEILNSAEKPIAGQTSLVKQNSVKPDSEIYSSAGLVTQPKRTSEYGSISQSVSSPESIYSSAGLGGRVEGKYGPAPSSVNSQTVYDSAPTLETPIYDKVPPISQYGSVKDLEEPKSASYKTQYGILPSDSKLSFFEAVKNNDLSKVKSMLATDKELANARDEKGYRALHWVQNKDIAKLLIDNGANLSVAAKDHTLPIYWAKKSGNADLAAYFEQVEEKQRESQGSFAKMVTSKSSQSGQTSMIK